MEICGFMRTSNIGRVDDTEIMVTNTYVRFAVVSLKEKRGGSTTEKHFKSKSFTNNNKLTLTNLKMKFASVISVLSFLAVGRPVSPPRVNIVTSLNTGDFVIQKMQRDNPPGTKFIYEYGGKRALFDFRDPGY
ncbi:hypothetical protein BB560_000246 [Smittium megazygosporum]|uniref:Uncharacterized protein n=1 Tax=Smittium megazygosporum TaxID=133381 RepID=A0A2T9ZKW2_9FUNG|nr:hypothetical protein BB560_000246 [Smittium megazygosporum]